MFHVLHRIYLAAWVALIVGLTAWVYQRTGISEPVVDWYTVWQNKSDISVRPVGEISGTVIKVPDGASIMVRGTDRHNYSIALLGLVPPPFQPNTAEGDLAIRSRARLNELVRSNEVQITLTWIDEQRRGVGVVRVGETNVNALMVESGLVEFKRRFVKGLPLLDQYAFARADRRSKEAKGVVETAVRE